MHGPVSPLPPALLPLLPVPSRLERMLAGISVRKVEVLVLCVDMRSYCEFTQTVVDDDTYALQVLGTFYAQVGGYFRNPEPSSLKLLGDGALLFWEIPRGDPAGIARRTVDASFGFCSVMRSAYSDFSRFPRGGPGRIGIGIARGLALRLDGPEMAFPDYVGQPVNLASRLTNFARPEGMAVSSSLGLSEEEIFEIGSFSFFGIHQPIKGLGEQRVYVTRDVEVKPDRPIFWEPFCDPRFGRSESSATQP